MDFNKLISECTAYDFKAEVEHRKSKSWLKSVSAFANGIGGSLFFGIDDDKNIVGIADVKQETEYLSETIKSKLDPIPNFNLDVHNFDGKIVIQLKVFGGNSTPYYYFNEGSRIAYIRVGNESIIAPNDRLMSLILKGNNSTYDSVVTSKTTEDFTFINLATEYRNRVHLDFNKKYLESFGLVTKNGFLTNAGLLLTDYCPVYQSRVFCTLWNGKEKINAVNDAEYSGNLLQLLQNALNFIKSSTKNGWIKLPNTRFNYPDYSERAVLECLVNHLIHRDYTVMGGEVHVDIFDDRIVFSSPGGMYDGTLIQNCDIDDVPSCRRNPVIADVAQNVGENVAQNVAKTTTEPIVGDGDKNDVAKNVAQNVGENVAKNVAKTATEGIVEAIDENVTKNVGENVAKTATEGIVEDVAKNTNVAKTATEDRISMITQLISENNYISRKEIADKLNVSQKTIERLLAENTDLIKHEGPKNGGYWVIKK